MTKYEQNKKPRIPKEFPCIFPLHLTTQSVPLAEEQLRGQLEPCQVMRTQVQLPQVERPQHCDHLEPC